MRLFRRRGPEVRLSTPRFDIRTMSRAQFARLSLPWTDDAEMMESFERRSGGWTLRRWEKALFRPDNRHRFMFGIWARENGAFIGYEGVQINRSDVAYLMVAIGREWWGRGTVVETRPAVLDHLFTRTACARAWGATHCRNLPSIANYHMLGFRHEGVLRGHLAMSDGTRGDAVVFGTTREEWLARRKDAR
jgi:RimJ/RimL family protein N-acetyltransferase